MRLSCDITALGNDSYQVSITEENGGSLTHIRQVRVQTGEAEIEALIAALWIQRNGE